MGAMRLSALAPASACDPSPYAQVCTCNHPQIDSHMRLRLDSLTRM